ncbi:FMN-binding protein [Microbacterium galbinum]|uniref:FMN-binding protein n=1 Tax=Microbacterium galbinum TaxID=2851646 RepID=A0ABY4IPH1_9MICO|nr:FMN-binding protein [Microbacterium galbinum]UPL13183.1 FMN-binding protein [Microbacterium galbinum]
MIRTTVPTSVRKGSALVGIAGLLVLAGCATTPTGTGGTTDSTSGTDSATGSESSSGADASSSYADGTYTAEGSYQTPESVETISVTLTLADGVVTDVEVTGDPQARETEQYQGAFIDGISEEVEGKALDDLNVSRVAGSSLTSGGFNAAVDDIKEQAAA